MNIKEAKIQISNTLKAYLQRDALGNYLIPAVRQRPILLMGPPGIGKTQIMEQIASETGVGLVAYTITHHTRQSAIGLPFIEKHSYDGIEQSVTEYTMSEILSSVYLRMEETGIREGILFLDEINCVSETLAPMMLQFLQCKTFGNRKLPEGWLIVAAGNPPEYNKSVRDFDVVTLDRVKLMNVEEDFSVWKEYAVKKGLHGAIISYLDIKKDHFYHIETTADGLQFATARGWEDLSEIILAYEALDITVDRGLIEQYIRIPRIARDFANYLSLYYKYRKTYHVDDILNGCANKVIESQFGFAPFDEKLAVMGLLYSRLSEVGKECFNTDALCRRLHASLLEYKAAITECDPVEAMKSLIAKRRSELHTALSAGHADKEQRNLMQLEINSLEDLLELISKFDKPDASEAFAAVKEQFSALLSRRSALAEETGAYFNNSIGFLEKAVGQGQELVMFITEITAGYYSSWFVQTFGCEAYFRNNSELLFSDARRRILDDIADIMSTDEQT